MRPPIRHIPRLVRSAQPASRTRLAQAATTAAAMQPQQQPQPPSRTLSTTSACSSSSVNETEISHFSALASSWWDPHGPSRPLHLMNPLRHDFISACLSSSPSSPSSPSSEPTGLRYLDVGCGGGIFAESAARLPTTASVTAIDPSPTILAVARAHAKRDPTLISTTTTTIDLNGEKAKEPKLNYVNTPIESLPLPADPSTRYDVVTLFEVIEHVDYPSVFLSRVAEFVRPGGWLVLSTIARTWTSWVTTNLVAEDILGVVPKGTHDWSKYINEAELRGWFAKDGGKEGGRVWGTPRVMGVVYVPGLGWREVRGSEKVGNYFFGVQRVA